MNDVNPDAVSIDAVIKALYESISGYAGAPRDWERDRALYAPGALLFRCVAHGGRRRRRGRDPRRRRLHPIAHAVLRGERLLRGRDRAARVHFGAMAHVLSVYEGRDAPDGRILKRGINSIQLFHDGARWWVVSIMWDNERDGVALPSEFGV